MKYILFTNKKKSDMKNELLKSMNDIHEEMKSITKSGSCGEFSGPVEYEDTKSIIDTIIKSPIVGNLLNLFWQRRSDACPLECTEAEQQEYDFKEWVKTMNFDSLVSLARINHCMPDGINSKEEHEQYLKDIGLF